MTDRHSGYIVVLETDLRSDDAEATLNAIRQIKGIVSVDPIVADINDACAATRERIRIMNAILEIFKP